MSAKRRFSEGVRLKKLQGRPSNPSRFSMPSEAADRQLRREAIRTFCRLGENLDTPERLRRDSGKETVETFLENLVPRLQTAEELEELRGAIGLWNQNSPIALLVPPLPGAGRDQAGEAANQGIDGASGGEEGGAAARPRVHAADIQLTFNHDWCQGDGVEVWFAGWGQELVQRLLTWAREEFPSRFAPNRVAHTSLTIEQSMSSHQPRVHVHCQFTFARRIDRTRLGCLVLKGLTCSLPRVRRPTSKELRLLQVWWPAAARAVQPCQGARRRSIPSKSSLLRLLQ